MDKAFAIFDMDGTLVDSMGYWRDLAPEYLGLRGVDSIPEDLLERIRPMTMAESTALFIRELGLSGTAEEMAADMNDIMADHYRHHIPLKPGMKEYLAALRDRGVRMCVASATAEPLVAECLTRLGVADCFDFLLSCESVGVGKNRPDVYHAAAKRLGAARPEDVAVFEDAYYAVKTAREAGYYVVAVYDAVAANRWEELKALANEYIADWRGAI